MKKISILALIMALLTSVFAVANEVNVFNARHYKADAELYSKFTNKTGIKVSSKDIVPIFFIFPLNLKVVFN